MKIGKNAILCGLAIGLVCICFTQPFCLSPEEIIKLKKEGVSDEIILELIRRDQETTVKRNVDLASIKCELTQMLEKFYSNVVIESAVVKLKQGCGKHGEMTCRYSIEGMKVIRYEKFLWQESIEIQSNRSCDHYVYGVSQCVSQPYSTFGTWVLRVPSGEGKRAIELLKTLVEYARK